MEGKIFGIPVVLIVLVFVIVFLNSLVMVGLHTASQRNVDETRLMQKEVLEASNVTPTPTASPSATPTPTTRVIRRVATPTPTTE